jgi:hypothetical protein
MWFIRFLDVVSDYLFALLCFVLLSVTPFFCAGCSTVPPECAAYCERIEQWAEQCKKPKFSLMSCTERFRCDPSSSDNSCAVNALSCWQNMLEWSPNPQAEFDCTVTAVPRL